MTTNSCDDGQASSIHFLSDDFVKEANEILRLPDEITEAYHKAVTLMNGNIQLRRLAWESHCKLYCADAPDKHEAQIWPERSVLEQLMGKQAGIFAAVVLISGLPKLQTWYRSKGIATEVLVDTLSDVEIWMRHYHKKQGVWGLEMKTSIG